MVQQIGLAHPGLPLDEGAGGAALGGGAVAHGQQMAQGQILAHQQVIGLLLHFIGGGVPLVDNPIVKGGGFLQRRDAQLGGEVLIQLVIDADGLPEFFLGAVHLHQNHCGALLQGVQLDVFQPQLLRPGQIAAAEGGLFRRQQPLEILGVQQIALGGEPVLEQAAVLDAEALQKLPLKLTQGFVL